MRRIIAIGGGNIKEKTTLIIDQFILNLISKEEKKVLLIPIASGDNEQYIETFCNYYSSLNAKVDVLRLSQISNDCLIRSKIFSADIIYIGGGNVGKLMRVIKRLKVNEYLIQAYQNGTILCGISAGAMIYFESGYSDCNKSTNINAPYTKVKGLNLLPYCFTPHYNHQERKGFDEFIRLNQFNGLALADDCAVLFEDEQITSKLSNSLNKNYLFINQQKKEL